METSPPVRDVSERNRANRNKCIIVAVTTVVIVAAIVAIISYITHFSSTELTPESASALIDKAVSNNKNDSVLICSSFEIILKENDTSLIERVGDCIQTAPPAREDIDKRNETSDEPAPHTNITCKLSLAKLKILALQNSSIQFKECHVNSALEVEFVFSETDNKVQNITIRQADPVTGEASVSVPERRGGRRDQNLILGLQNLVAKILADDILELTAEYSTADTTVTEQIPSISEEQVCRTSPWHC